MKNLSLLLALICSVLAAVNGFAHSVWLEPNAAGDLMLRFAEPDGKFEKSPGHLDELSQPVAWKPGASNAPVALIVEKKSDHFQITDAKAADSVQAETDFQVMTTPGRPGRLPHFYARWHPPGAGAATPSLTLDLVPTGKPGEVRVFFRGQPLGGIKATLRTPDEKEQELSADNEGYLRFAATQPGQHMLSIARHRETVGGFAGGRVYDLTSHNASLTWRQP